MLLVNDRGSLQKRIQSFCSGVGGTEEKQNMLKTTISTHTHTHTHKQQNCQNFSLKLRSKGTE